MQNLLYFVVVALQKPDVIVQHVCCARDVIRFECMGNINLHKHFTEEVLNKLEFEYFERKRKWKVLLSTVVTVFLKIRPSPIYKP